MNTYLTSLAPSITKMIRMDHSHVLITFHNYRPDSSLQMKQGIVNTACTALEIHAQLEEEIFYPALRALSPNDATLDKSVPEHNEMKRLIGRLRGMQPDDPEYDACFMELMRDVMHHVADEETQLLPLAENRLADQLQSLGAQMTRRRLQLAGPRAGEIAVDTVRAMPVSSVVMAMGGLLAGMFVLQRAFGRRA